MFKSTQEFVYAELNEDIAAVITRTWQSAAFQACYDKRHEIELMESAK